MIRRKRPVRIYVGAAGVNDIRSVLGNAPLAPDDPLAAKPYFVETGDAYLDVRVDREHGAGLFAVHPFVGLNRDKLRSEWESFVKASPARPDSPKVLVLETALQTDEETQAKLHEVYVREHIKEPLVADALLSVSLQKARRHALV